MKTVSALYEIDGVSSFDSFIGEKDKFLNVVLLTAPWLIPGRSLESHIHNIIDQDKDNIKFAIINIDDNQDIAINLGITSFPSLLLYKDEIILDKITGAFSEDQLNSKIDMAMNQ